jgi:hypothetical protein
MSQYGYTGLGDKIVTAKKKHQCIWCGEKILPGEKYERQVGIYYGDFQYNKWHLECRDAWHKASREYFDIDGEFQPYSNKRGSAEEA